MELAAGNGYIECGTCEVTSKRGIEERLELICELRQQCVAGVACAGKHELVADAPAVNRCQRDVEAKVGRQATKRRSVRRRSDSYGAHGSLPGVEANVFGAI